jgi:hypothetical protein
LRRDGIVNEDGSRSAQGFFLEGPRNRVLGWFEEPGVEDVVAHLQPGDRVILYTDGFLEAKTPDGEVFGEHRFGDALLRLEGLEPEALIQQMVEDVERFAAGKLDDDLTMLVVEWLGASADEPVDPSGEQRWHSKR